MLNADDSLPIIKHALHRRLGKEPGVRVADVRCLVAKDHIAVFVDLAAGDLGLHSEFHLPLEFEHAHLIDQIDEIAEQVKAARMSYWLSGRQTERRELSGTGLRGRWAQYG